MFSQLKSIGSNKCCERNFINTNLGTKFFFGGGSKFPNPTFSNTSVFGFSFIRRLESNESE